MIEGKVRTALPLLAERFAWGNWWSKLVAIVMLLNLLLVGFNATYLTFRDIYWQYAPALVKQYDPIKGVEPYPETQQFLTKVDQFEQQASATGLNDPAIAPMLAELRQQSQSLFTENTFVIANKVAQLARVKRQVRTYTDAVATETALAQFWTVDFLQAFGWDNAQTWLDQSVKPLLATNYYRFADENGLVRDRFWLIDIYFVSFLGIEFLLKSLLISQRTVGINWLDAIIRRWYMLIFLLPTWRWLRLVPTVVQIHQSRLVDLERVLSQATYEPAAYLSDRVSKFVLVRLINQTQESVEQGAVLDALVQSEVSPQAAPSPAEELTDRLLQAVVYQAMPAIEPELEQLLRHSLQTALQEANWYQNLLNLPGLSALSQETVENLADYLAQSSCDALINAYDDAEGRRLFEQLNVAFRQAIAQDLQTGVGRDRIQTLLIQMLEDMKGNYLAQSERTDPTDTLAEAEQLSEREQTRPDPEFPNPVTPPSSPSSLT